MFSGSRGSQSCDVDNMLDGPSFVVYVSSSVATCRGCELISVMFGVYNIHPRQSKAPNTAATESSDCGPFDSTLVASVQIALGTCR